MPHWKDIGAWLAAVVEHWELIVVTGAIPFFLDLVDKMFDWKMPKKFYVVFIAIGLVLAMFSAWREEREGKDNSETKQHQFEQKFNQCDAEHSTLKNLADTYASQLANQQATVNTCVVTLAKNAAGEPQRTMVWTVGLGIVKQPIVTEMVLVTNKATTFRGNLSCENPFHIFDW